MKRKNRKKERPMLFPAPFAAFLVVVGVFALVYLWICGRCEALGKQITSLEKRKVEVHRKVLNEEYKWCKIKSPQNMKHLLRRHQLDMLQVQEDRIVRIPTYAGSLEMAATKEPTPYGTSHLYE